MNATKKSNLNYKERIILDTCELQERLGCGRASAVKIGTDAHARITVGRRVFWNQKKIQEYLERMAE